MKLSVFALALFGLLMFLGFRADRPETGSSVETAHRASLSLPAFELDGSVMGLQGCQDLEASCESPPFQVYRVTSTACPDCHAPDTRFSFLGRGTFYWRPDEQENGKAAGANQIALGALPNLVVPLRG